MNKEINIEDIRKFQDSYEHNSKNSTIEEKIRNMGVMKASIDENKKALIEFKFNIEIPEVDIQNQYDSHQCNIFAFIRVLKDIIRKKNIPKLEKVDFSSNYINFFDKLEKINTLYNYLIESDDLSLDLINSKTNQYIGSFGTFHFCREIINKYGLVPTKNMKELNKNYDDALTLELLKNKVKSDALSLLKINNKEDRKLLKKYLMNEIYQFLSKTLGNPPQVFNFDGIEYTPKEFKNKYLGNELENYITVTSFDLDSLYNSYSFIPNIYLENNEHIRKLSVGKVKEAVVKQLKDGISVWFSAEESTTLDYDYNILDDILYDYHELLNIKRISKNKKLLLDLINYDHAMCITGALVLKSGVKQFKVDNSFGRHGDFKGQLIMTDSFFDNCVITVVINKKYLN